MISHACIHALLIILLWVSFHHKSLINFPQIKIIPDWKKILWLYIDKRRCWVGCSMQGIYMKHTSIIKFNTLYS